MCYKKLLSLLLGLVITCSQTFAQDMRFWDSVMVRKVPNCPDVTFNSMRLIPTYYQRGTKDSMEAVINYWTKRCGYNSLVFRAKLLNEIATGRFNEDLYDKSVIDDMIYYERYVVNKKQTTNSIGKIQRYYTDDEYDSLGRRYNDFIKQQARDALQKTNSGQLENLLASHYAGDTDSTFIKLQSPEFQDTKLKKYYDESVTETFNTTEGYYGGYAGWWMPTSSDNKILGSHPQIGILFGLSGSNWDYNLYLDFRFGKTNPPYSFTYNGTTQHSTDYLNGELGFDAGYKVLYRPRQEIILIAGVNIGGYTPTKADGSEYDKGVNAMNFAIGIGYGFKLDNLLQHQIQIQVRHDFYLVNLSDSYYDAPQGNALSVRLIYHYIPAFFRANRLKDLSYPKTKYNDD